MSNAQWVVTSYRTSSYIFVIFSLSLCQPVICIAVMYHEIMYLLLSYYITSDYYNKNTDCSFVCYAWEMQENNR